MMFLSISSYFSASYIKKNPNFRYIEELFFSTKGMVVLGWPGTAIIEPFLGITGCIKHPENT